MSTHRRPPSRGVLLVAAVLATIAAAEPVTSQTPATPTAATGVAATAPSARDRWADSAARLVSRGTSLGDRAMLAAARTLLERALVAMPDDPLLLHYAGYALYREAVEALVAARDEKAGKREAEDLLERAESYLDRSAKRMPLAETQALRSSVIGMRIGVGSNPMAGMWLGPKASSAMEAALKLGPRNPRVWLLRGTSALNTPKAWGGGEAKAREYLATAVALFAADRPAAAMPAWGAAEAQLWLGRSYLALGQRDSARAAYARARTLDPENQWLTRVLIPEAERAGAAP